MKGKEEKKRGKSRLVIASLWKGRDSERRRGERGRKSSLVMAGLWNRRDTEGKNERVVKGGEEEKETRVG